MLPRCIFARLDANSRLRTILLIVPLLDEIVTTFPVVGIPRGVRIGTGIYAGADFCRKVEEVIQDGQDSTH